MIEANGLQVLTDVYDILVELRSCLEVNGIKRFYKIIKTPGNVMTCCPFHKEGQERKPSFGILEKDGTCHCFSCGWVGSIQEMISNCFGYNDFGAYGNKWLVKNFVTANVETRPDIGLDCDRTPKKVSNKNYVTEEELDEYRWNHPYWAKRKITSPEIIELFDLGYDKSTECITFPVRNADGKCLFVARRSVKTKFFNYPQGVEKPLYGLYELLHIEDELDLENEELIITESMIDTLTCWEYGKYSVAMNGLGSDLQIKQLRELPCRKLILATDMDEAGLRARKRIKKSVTNKLITEYKWDLSKWKDINDMSKEDFDNLQEFM